jgi:polyisoprenoid-binding protein YceI
MTSTVWWRGMVVSALLAGSYLSSVTAADAVNWKLDAAKSQLGFSGTQTGAAFAGKFKDYTAAIAFDPANLAASHITITVDLASAVTGDTQRDTALSGQDWFDVAKFPQAVFQTTGITKVGPNEYDAVGSLSLRGVAKPLTLPFTLQIDGATAHAVGHVNLVRTDFGVGQGAWASGQWVALAVAVGFNIVATKGN